MRIKGYDIYGLQDKSFKEEDNLRSEGNQKIQLKKTIDSEIFDSFQQRLERSRDFISQSEKQYFKELFPDSSQQIESHVVFNQAGRLQKSNVQKGVILDTVV